MPGPIWPPTNIAGCVGWYDMLDGVYTESAGSVTAVRNMVTGSDDMVEATNPPALGTGATGINGLPCLAPDGSNDRLISTEASVVAPFIGVDVALTITLVYQPTLIDSGARALFAAGNSGVATSRTMFYRRSSGLHAWLTISDTGEQTGGGTIDNLMFQTRPVVVSLVTGPPAANFQVVNGARVPPRFGGVTSVGQITPDRVAISCRPDSTPDLFDNSRIGAVIVHDKALAVDAVRGLHAALMGRWGITPP